MSKISAMMDIGRRSMTNSQTALQTVSHNIANKNTDGFSRQRVDLQTAVPVGNGKFRYGMGSKTASVDRVNNPYLEKQILNEGAELGFAEAKSQGMRRVEEVYNEQVNKGLNKYLASFFNAFRELSVSPENLANRTLVKEASINLARDFSRVSGQLKEIQNDLNSQVQSKIYKINEITEEIASLNQKIQAVELSGATPNDERDRRELLLKELAERVNIRWAEGDDGMVTVTAGNTALLVSGYEKANLSLRSVPDPEARGGATMRVFFRAKESLPPTDVTEQLNGGAVGANLNVRDEVIGELLDDVDQMAFEFANQVNIIHRQGYNRYNAKAGDLFVFKEGYQQKDAASQIRLSEMVNTDVGHIATSAIPDSSGDNRIANLISGLQYKNAMGNGKNTFDQFYNGLVGKVGVTSDQSRNRFESQKSIVEQLTNLRESISGVSLDEETTKMIEFQKTFDASARLIRAADEMLDTVLNIKR